MKPSEQRIVFCRPLSVNWEDECIKSNRWLRWLTKKQRKGNQIGMRFWEDLHKGCYKQSLLLSFCLKKLLPYLLLHVYKNRFWHTDQLPKMWYVNFSLWWFWTATHSWLLQFEALYSEFFVSKQMCAWGVAIEGEMVALKLEHGLDGWCWRSSLLIVCLFWPYHSVKFSNMHLRHFQ